MTFIISKIYSFNMWIWQTYANILKSVLDCLKQAQNVLFYTRNK